MNITDKTLQLVYDEVFEGLKLLDSNAPLLEDRRTQRRLLEERQR
jgi:hypothetical protein